MVRLQQLQRPRLQQQCGQCAQGVLPLLSGGSGRPASCGRTIPGARCLCLCRVCLFALLCLPCMSQSAVGCDLAMPPRDYALCCMADPATVLARVKCYETSFANEAGERQDYTTRGLEPRQDQIRYWAGGTVHHLAFWGNQRASVARAVPSACRRSWQC